MSRYYECPECHRQELHDVGLFETVCRLCGWWSYLLRVRRMMSAWRGTCCRCDNCAAQWYEQSASQVEGKHLP